MQSPERLGRVGWRNKLARAAWNAVYGLFFRFTPEPLHVVRALVLRAWGAKVDLSAHVYPSARVWAPWNLVMEKNACLGPNVTCYNVAVIRLGENATVSQNSHLCSASHDHRDAAMPLVAAPITIERGAWVCADAFVSLGVTIGEDAVVGARSVVLHDMPAGMVCAGQPCRPRKRRWEGGRP